ncbi:MAG TPA: zf-HC2 domain-containing protein [Bryobacteraceae bacterium]|jgi:hypothetical protein
MNCIVKDKAGGEVLMDYCAGALDPARAAEFEGHIRECAECRELVDAQRSLWQTLGEWKPIEVSRDFDARLYARIAQADAEPWFYRMWKPVLSIAAVATAAAVMFAVRPAVRVEPPAGPAAQVEQINIQEVQQALDDLDLLSPASPNTRKPL